MRTGQSLDFCRVEACADERSRRKGRLARSVLGAQLSILLVHRESLHLIGARLRRRLPGAGLVIL